LITLNRAITIAGLVRAESILGLGPLNTYFLENRIFNIKLVNFPN